MIRSIAFSPRQVIIGGPHVLDITVYWSGQEVIGQEVVDLGFIDDRDQLIDQPVADGGIPQHHPVHLTLGEIGPLTGTIRPFRMLLVHLRERGDVAETEMHPELHAGRVGGVGQWPEAFGEEVLARVPLRVFPAEIDHEEFDPEFLAAGEATPHRGVIDLVAIAPAS